MPARQPLAGSLVGLALFLAMCAVFQIGFAKLCTLSAAEGRRVALVIGNSRYVHTPALQNSRADATDIAAALEAIGFSVTRGLDLGKAAMDELVGRFSSTLDGAEAGVFYYAGHGLQVSGQNYLIPVDARLASESSIDFELVKVESVQMVMEGNGRIGIIFLDACRDNPLARNLARSMGGRSIEVGRGLASMLYGRDMLISFATQPGNVALDGDGRNSPFTAALVGQILNSSESISDMLTQVRVEVLAATSHRQIPWEHSSLTKKFYFKPGASGVITQGAVLSMEQLAEIAFWNSVRDSRNAEVIRSYVDAYPKGSFVSVAKAILAELGHETATGRDSGKASFRSDFDGRWKVRRVGKNCPKDLFKFEIVMDGRSVDGELGPSWRITGSVAPSGAFEFSHEGRPHGITRYSGTLKGKTGRGDFAVEGGLCRGTFTAERL